MKLLKPGTYFMPGNIAVAEAALIAGCRFYAGYPITPSSDIMEHMAKRLPEVGGVFIQAEDEIAAINMVLGASAAGLKAMTATSGPGLSLMEEALGLGFMLELPAVIVDVQRVGPSTGIPTLGAQGDLMQAVWGSHGDRETVVLAPANPQEAFDLTIKAFNIAEELRMPVILLSDQFVGHSYGRVKVPDLNSIEIVERKRASKEGIYKPFKTEDLVPLFAEPGQGFRFHYESLVHDENGYPVIDRDVAEKLLRRLLDKVRKNKHRLKDFEIFPQDVDRADTMFVVFGSLSGVVKEVVRRLQREGRKFCVFRPRIVWPFPDEDLVLLAEKMGVEKVLVLEMNYGQLVHIVRDALQKKEVEVLHVSFTPGFYPTTRDVMDRINKVMS